jgi:hypothetical protein
MSPAPSATESQIPAPTRYWWLKRILVLAIGLIVGLIVAQRWWGYTADLRYQSLIESVRARGEPILPADFVSGGFPDSRNAASSLIAAAQSLKLTQSYHDFADNYPGEEAPLTASEIDICKTAVAANAKSLSLVRVARSQPEVDWKIQLATPVVSTLLPQLNSQRELVQFMRWSVRAHHAQGDDAEAVEELRDMLAAGHTVNRGPGTLVTHLVALGLNAVACQAVAENAFDLQVEGVTTTQPATRPATRDQIRDLIHDLTDDDAYRADAVHAWQGERMLVLDGGMYMANGARPGFYSTPALPAPVRPMIEMDAVDAANTISEVIEAVKLPTLPAARAKFPRLDKRGDSLLEGVSKFTSRIFLPALGRGVQQEFNSSTLRHVAALRLAIRMYRLDHDGKYPSDLKELVPKYIPALPADPFAADGRPLTYIGEPRLVIYSVGENGVDDGGTTSPVSGFGGGTPQDWGGRDVVFPLLLPPPSTQPSPETQDHQ